MIHLTEKEGLRLARTRGNKWDPPLTPLPEKEEQRLARARVGP